MNDFTDFSFQFENDVELDMGDMDSSALADCEAMLNDQDLYDFSEGNMLDFENQVPEYAEDPNLMEAYPATPATTKQFDFQRSPDDSATVPNSVVITQTEEANVPSEEFFENPPTREPQLTDVSFQSHRTKTLPLTRQVPENDRKRLKQNRTDQQATGSSARSGGDRKSSLSISTCKKEDKFFSLTRLSRPKILGSDPPATNSKKNAKTLDVQETTKPGDVSMKKNDPVSKKQVVAAIELKTGRSKLKFNLNENLRSNKTLCHPPKMKQGTIEETKKSTSSGHHGPLQDETIVDGDGSGKVLEEFDLLRTQIEESNFHSDLTKQLGNENLRIENEEAKAEERKRSISSQIHELIREMETLESGVMNVLVELIDLKTEYLLVIDPEFEENLESLIKSYTENSEEIPLKSPRSPDPEIRPSQIASL